MHQSIFKSTDAMVILTIKSTAFYEPQLKPHLWDWRPVWRCVWQISQPPLWAGNWEAEHREQHLEQCSVVWRRWMLVGGPVSCVVWRRSVLMGELRRLEKTRCLATSFAFVEGKSLLLACPCLMLQNVHQTMIAFKRNMSHDTSSFWDELLV